MLITLDAGQESTGLEPLTLPMGTMILATAKKIVRFHITSLAFRFIILPSEFILFYNILDNSD